MRIDKIIYLVSSPFNQRDEQRFGIDTVQKSGFSVEVWDLTSVINPERAKKFTPADKSNFSGYRIFNTKEEFISAASKLKKETLFVLFNYIYEVYAVFRVISEYSIPYCLALYNFPTTDIGALKRLKNFTFKKLLTHLMLRIPYRCLGIKPAKMALILSARFNLSGYPVDEKTEIIWAHYYDYDVYLQVRQKEIKVEEKLGVFLDDYLPFHPDFMAPPLTQAQDYYPLLCSFFDSLEKKYAVRIVVAAHPRSHYEKLPAYFGARQVIRGQTAELVKNSAFVIAHESASLSFALLFKKPVIFITTDALKKSPVGPVISFMAKMLGKSEINLNDFLEINPDIELAINEKAYSSYIANYIKKNGSPDTPIWESFVNGVKNLA